MVVDKFGRGLESYKRTYTFDDDDETHDFDYKRIANVGAPEEDTDAVTKLYLDTLLDSFVTKDVVQSIQKDLGKVQYFFDFENKRIVRLNEPTASFHAVTKAYVDDKDKIAKHQIRAECEKVKREAMAEGNKKREAIRTELLNFITVLGKRIDALEANMQTIKTSINTLDGYRRINTVYLDALYKRLNIEKSSISIKNVSEGTSN